jgi:predicted nucleic acid-binding protein
VSVQAPPPGAALPAGGPALHPGETQAILLASSLPGSLSILDETGGRRVAARLGVNVIGVVGILVLARQRGLVPNLAPELQQLRGPGGFRMSAQVYQLALRLAGES